MGIELYSQILSLNNVRRCRRSKGQLVPSGANTFANGMPLRSFTWPGLSLTHRTCVLLLTLPSASKYAFRRTQ